MKRSNRLSIKTSFQLIQGLILLLLVVLVFQSIVFWRACQRGSQATNGLEQEGLPSLRLLASLQENLAVYRLHSFEIMFAQDKDRPAKLAETDAVQQRNADIIGQLKQLYPEGEGHQHVVALTASLDGYVETMGRIRATLDKDFAGAMKILDQEVPAKVADLNAAAEQVKTYCTGVANERTGLTVASLQAPIDFIEVGTPLTVKHSSHCFLGPVEWDRMGDISYGLWLHVAPGTDRLVGDIRGDGVVSVAYDGGTLVLKAREAPKLGREPYTPLVPWGQTAYFDLNADSLAQLARSRQLQLILRGADSNPVVFDPGGPTSVTLKTFASSRGITVD